jgi:hypothetical protein
MIKSLFLAWQAPSDSARSRAWFPVGRLDAEVDNSVYKFRYTRGAITAERDVGFKPLFAFPDFKKVYESNELFPLFKNRVLSSKRTDFHEYIRWLDLDQGQADPISILEVSGGGRATDNLEVFPKVSPDADGQFHVRFFLHGLRHLGSSAIERASRLEVGENLRIMVELNNPATRLAVPLLTEDYQMAGWAPRYLVEDLIMCVPRAPEIFARVARINSDIAPLNQRYLIDYYGRTPAGAQLMSTPDFLPIVGDDQSTFTNP